MTPVLLLVTLHVSVFAMLCQTRCTVSSTSVVEEVEDAFDFELNFSVNGVVPKKMNQVLSALFRSDSHCTLGVKKPGHLKTASCQSSKLAFDGSFNFQLVGGSDGPIITFMNEPNCCTVVRIVAARISMKHKTGTSGDCRLASALVITLSSVDIADFFYEMDRNKLQGSQMSKQCRSESQLDPFLHNVFMECSQHGKLRVFYCLFSDCLNCLNETVMMTSLSALPTLNDCKVLYTVFSCLWMDSTISPTRRRQPSAARSATFWVALK